MDEDEDELPQKDGLGGVDAPVIEDSQPISADTLATEMGWTAKDKWIEAGRDPEGWKPAHEFVRDTVNVNRSIKRQIKGLEDQVSTMARTSAVLTEQALADQREKLLAVRADAIDMGDHAAVAQADQKLQTLNVTIPRPVEPEVAAFTERNEWFEKDKEATTWAVNRADELARTGIGTARQLAIVEREAKQLFPELYPEAKPKAKAADLNAPGNRGSKPQGKGFASLPETAKQAALDYEKRSKGKITREMYAQTYHEEQGA
jgi:hypothetical protein